jgi:putative FmdB family regulatory protein
MPTYEYKCDACGHTFERFQSITAAPVKRCPECGKSKVRRLISTGAGLIFKGSGFYITDYRDKSYTDQAKADSGGGSSETKTEKTDKMDSKSETKAESKPAAEKPATKSESKSASKSASKSRKK